jgi:hypothetical protein
MVLPPLRDRFIVGLAGKFRECPVPLSVEWMFKPLWNKNRTDFIERGFALRSHNDRWFLQQWLLPDGKGYTLTPIGQERLEVLQGPRDSALSAAPEPETQLDLPSLPMGLEEKLFDYQVQPARQLLNALTTGADEWNYPGAWDCSALGTGKTYQALAAAIGTGLEVGVICPLSVIPAWKNAFKHFGEVPRFIRNYESLRTGNRDYVKLEQYRDKRTGHAGRRFNWTVSPTDTVLLFDEAHMVKGGTTKNAALAIAAIRQRFPLIFISGTLASDPTHMRATGRAVGLHEGGESYNRFLLEHGCEQSPNRGMTFIGGKKGRFYLTRIHLKVFPKRGARTRIEDLGDRFPETQIMVEAYETGETAAINKAFKVAAQTIENLTKQGMSEGQAKMLSQTAWMKAFHESERLKVPAICEKVQEELEEGRSVVVFVNFTDVREALMTKLKTQCAIYGGQHALQREQAIADFQADKARVIVANIDAGGVGVSLHDLNGDYPRTAIIMPTCKVVSITQALGRVHRAGGKTKSRQIVFYSTGFEETICQNIRRKVGNLTALNDGEMMPVTHFDQV